DRTRSPSTREDHAKTTNEGFPEGMKRRTMSPQRVPRLKAEVLKASGPREQRLKAEVLKASGPREQRLKAEVLKASGPREQREAVQQLQRNI
ncbi:unnamed protein product, partial [Cyprideis torosa]